MPSQKINLRKLLVIVLPRIPKLEDKARLFEFINRCGDELIIEFDIEEVIIGESVGQVEQ